jgi:uncharacterized repeat protein (TIGR03803 family)
MIIQNDYQNRRQSSFTRFGPCGTLFLLLLWPCSGRPQTFSVLHEFCATNAGCNPQGGLVQGADGALYGTTCFGGNFNFGTVFKLGTNGSDYTVLHHFTGADGATPQSALVVSGATLYGTSPYTSNHLGGTIFKLNTDGTGFTVLQDFTGRGDAPTGGLLLEGTTLYGTTQFGGVAGQMGHGTVFKLTTEGNVYSVLWKFSGTDGASPVAPLLLSGTTLYGTTIEGGAVSGYSYGTVFKLNTDGSGFVCLKSFLETNGIGPNGSLALLGDTLYGTTYFGGDLLGGASGRGTVFKLHTDGTGFALLKTLSDAEGALLYSGLTPVGNVLYGAARSTLFDGFPQGPGFVFSMHTNGTGFKVVKPFTYRDGANPCGGLLLSGTTLYGTTAAGGASSNGVVFALSLASPALLAAPRTQTAERGSTVALSAKAEGAEPLMYLWIFNETNVLNVNPKPLLQLTNIQSSDAGAYAVVVTNFAGAITSPPALLNVIAAVDRRSVPGIAFAGQEENPLNLDYTSALAPIPARVPLETVTVTSASPVYFDLTTPLPSQRFYRAWQTNSPGPPSALNLNLIPALTLTGSIGSSVRVDYINKVGPIDDWVTLDTITLTNTSQLYFDVSSISQPTRLYRLVPVP